MKITERQLSLLNALDHAISQEEHILIQQPALFYQQIHNRLAWVKPKDESLEDYENLLGQPYTVPWIESRFSPKESTNVVKVLQGHAAPINGCAINRAGRLALSVGSDGTIRIWDLSSNLTTFELDLNTTLYCCDWSPGNNYFAAGDRYGTSYLFQEGQAKPVELSGHKDYIYCCAFSPGGEYLLTGSGDRTVRLWDVKAGQEIHRFEGFESGIIQLKFSPDGQSFVTTSNDRMVAIWDLKSKQIIRKFTEEYLAIQALAVSKDGRYLLTCGGNRIITLRNYHDLQIVNQVKAPQKVINTCAFSPDGRFFAYAGDKDLVIGTPDNMEIRATYSGHNKQIKDFAFSPDGSLIITAGLDQSLRLWQLNLEKVDSLGNNMKFLKSRFFVPGNALITSNDQGNFNFWNKETGEPEKDLSAHSSGITEFNFDISGKLLVSCDREKAIKLWNTENNQLVAVLGTSGAAPIKAEAIISKGKVLSLSRDLHIRTIDITTRKPVGEFQADDFRSSPDESMLAFTYSGFLNEHSVSLVEISEQKKLTIFKGHEAEVNDFQFTHKSDKLVTVSDDRTVRVWDCRSFEEVLTFTEHNHQVVKLSISPDDSMVLSLDDYGELILWHLADGSIIYRFHTKLQAHGECFFSPDMTLIIYGGDSNWVRVHRIKDGQQIAAIPTFGGIEKMALHPFQPQVTGVDANGNLYLYQLNNISYGPIFITPYNINGALSFICPACQKSPMLKQTQLGQVIQCPTESCHLPIRLNSFTMQVTPNIPEKRKRGLFRKR